MWATSAHDGAGDLHHQWDRACRSQPVASITQAHHSPMIKGERMRAERCFTRLGSFPIADPGSILNSTREIFSMCASIVAGKCRLTICSKLLGIPGTISSKMYYPVEEIRVSKGKLFRKLDPEIHHGLRSSFQVTEKGGKDPIVKEGRKVDQGPHCQVKRLRESSNPPSLRPNREACCALDPNWPKREKEKIAEKTSD